jgi:hypothetical protein
MEHLISGLDKRTQEKLRELKVSVTRGIHTDFPSCYSDHRCWQTDRSHHIGMRWDVSLLVLLAAYNVVVAWADDGSESLGDFIAINWL